MNALKKFFPIFFVLALVKLGIQLLGNQNYGFHRDELLHLSVSEHLDWGFMEFPPFIGFLGKLSYWFFDYSLIGVRLFPTFAGVTILIFCCLICIEFGGKKQAIFLSGVCILAFLPFYRNHTLFQPVAFNQLFWTLGFYFYIRFIKIENKKFLIYLGITLGFGLLNKYTMLIWAFGILISILFYRKGNLFRNKWMYFSAILALLIFLPNIIWQIDHDFPILKHLQALKEHQLEEINPWEFGLAQLDYPFTLLVSILGIIGLFSDEKLKKYKSVAIACLFIFGLMWILNSKSYYVFGIYPVLFAAGSAKVSFVFSKKPVWIYAISAIVLLPSIYFIPEATPILSIENYIDYADLKQKNGRVELTSDYADMFGWEEQVKLVNSVYQSLNEAEKQKMVIWAENYGEAGAIKVLGKKYDLPNPISRHGSFWTWGYGNKNAEIWISLGNEKQVLRHVFEEIELVKTITHKYAVAEENNIPLYICRKPKIDIENWWLQYKDHIYD